jgi:hypothetical protein
MAASATMLNILFIRTLQSLSGVTGSNGNATRASAKTDTFLGTGRVHRENSRFMVATVVTRPEPSPAHHPWVLRAWVTSG